LEPQGIPAIMGLLLINSQANGRVSCYKLIPGGMPVNIITTLIGVPLFILLLLRQRA
jgi:ABC-type Fe3+-siderophore transport system permease subunit